MPHQPGPQRVRTPDATRNRDGAYAEIAELHHAFSRGLDPLDNLADAYRFIEARGVAPVWISLLPQADAEALLKAAIERKANGENLPLFGVPFAVKDNIDVAGLPTTAACPDFTYQPEAHAPVVARLIDAGAIPIGKTNLDQFATGLNGTRSPYGAPGCVFNDDYISGGSSSGSAVAVANGTVLFALGTDTAGSGRVPAAFNNVVGLKPTRGLLPNTGVVPAVRSLDCVSVFTANVADALLVASIAAGFEPSDPWSRRGPEGVFSTRKWRGGFRYGVPAPSDLTFHGDREAVALFDQTLARLDALGGTAVEVDFSPFREAAALLYEGPWVAERLAAIGDFVEELGDSVHPVVRDIVMSGTGFSARDAFEARYRLAELIRQAEATWSAIDVLVLPTAPTIFTKEAILNDPVRLNSVLGTYTNFVNLMDLSAIAVPAGFRSDGLPFGVTLVGQAFEDGPLAGLADRLHRSLPDARLGASGSPPSTNTAVGSENEADVIGLAVVGAHLVGQPLNPQLVEKGGRLRLATRTAPGYALYALADTVPPKPGLIREPSAAGGVEVEVWDLPKKGFAELVAQIPAPLCIGTVVLSDGTTVKGFLCEADGLDGARDITAFGGWRAYLAAKLSPSGGDSGVASAVHARRSAAARTLAI